MFNGLAFCNIQSTEGKFAEPMCSLFKYKLEEIQNK